MTLTMNEKDRGNSKPSGGNQVDVDVDFDFKNNVEFQAWLKNYVNVHQNQNQSLYNNNKIVSNNSNDSSAIATGGNSSSYSTSSGGNASVNVDVDFDPLVNYLQKLQVFYMYGKGTDFVFNTPITTNTVQGEGYLQGTEGSDYMVGSLLDTSVLFGVGSGDILTGGGSLIGSRGQDLLIGQGATYFEIQGGDMILNWESGSAIGFSKSLGAGDDVFAVNAYALFDGDRIAGAAILRNGFTAGFVAGVDAGSLTFI